MRPSLERLTGVAALAAALSAGAMLLAAPARAQQPAAPAQKAAPGAQKTAKAAPSKPRGGDADGAADQAIIALVNDEPITAYEVAQRERLLVMMSGAVSEYVQKNIQARWEKIVKNPNINEEFKTFAMKHNPRSQEDVQRLQKVFIEDKQKRMRDELFREAKASAGKGVRAKAQEELIEERIKLQEAKKHNLLADDAEVNTVIRDIAQRNKMTEAQFAQHIASQGGDIEAMKSRFRATLSWNNVVRRRFGHQISIAQREIDKVAAAGPAGEDQVELQLQKVLLPVAQFDQKASIARLADAEKVRAAFKDCKTIGSAIKGIAGARTVNLGARKPSSVGEPTRSMVLAARDGELLPPTVAAEGVELWAVCGRTVIKASEEKRNAAQDELRQKEFELLARRHLKDLRQDASIEFR